jgi:hypothetical protein
LPPAIAIAISSRWYAVVVAEAEVVEAAVEAVGV